MIKDLCEENYNSGWNGQGYDDYGGREIRTLEKQYLSNGIRIRGTEGLDLSLGELVYPSRDEIESIKKGLKERGSFVADLTDRGDRLLSRLVIGFFVAFFIVAMVISGSLFAGIGISALVLFLFLAYKKNQHAYNNAIENGTMEIYKFYITEKLYIDNTKNDTTDDYYIVIGNAMVEVGRKLYRALRVGGTVQCAIISDSEGKYFSLLC